MGANKKIKIKIFTFLFVTSKISEEINIKIGINTKIIYRSVKIGVFRGIFRVSDFNGRNVLVGCDKSYLPQYFVSIDEGEMGCRVDILGRREKWLVKALNMDKTIIKEIMSELISVEFPFVKSMKFIEEKMREYKFSDELCDEVLNNWGNLRKDLESEGVLFV